MADQLDAAGFLKTIRCQSLTGSPKVTWYSLDITEVPKGLPSCDPTAEVKIDPKDIATPLPASKQLIRS